MYIWGYISSVHNYEGIFNVIGRHKITLQHTTIECIVCCLILVTLADFLRFNNFFLYSIGTAVELSADLFSIITGLLYCTLSLVAVAFTLPPVASLLPPVVSLLPVVVLSIVTVERCETFCNSQSSTTDTFISVDLGEGGYNSVWRRTISYRYNSYK